MQSLERNGFTAEQLLALPRGQWRHELVRGELRTMSPAGWRHGLVAGNVAGILRAYVKAHQLGVVLTAETGCFLERNPDTVRAADVSFVARDRMATLSKEPGFLAGPPDLAVEVRSPGDTGPEVREKVDIWLQKGCRMVWVVDPERRRGEQHRPGAPPEPIGEDGAFSGGDVVPDFVLPLRDALSL